MCAESGGCARLVKMEKTGMGTHQPPPNKWGKCLEFCCCCSVQYVLVGIHAFYLIEN